MVVSKRSRKSRAAAAGRSIQRRRAPPVRGPLTLPQARALIRARQAARVPRSARAAAPTRARGVARRDAAAARRAEIARREREYAATLRLLARHGVRHAGPPGRALVTAPLQLLAEGDSWFDYPPFVLKGGIVPRLERRIGLPILNLAHAGDEVRAMLGVEERARLARHLRDGGPTGAPWDALLFSGGGNDIVGNPLVLWLHDWRRGASPDELIHPARFGAALEIVRAGYEDLIALRDALSPSTQLVFHGYDYAIPDGRGVCRNAFGPWLKPAFDGRGFPSRAAAFAVVRVMLARFAAMLAALPRAGVTVIEAQGLLPEGDVSWWHNELHPAQPGYDAHTEKFREALQALFPGRLS